MKRKPVSKLVPNFIKQLETYTPGRQPLRLSKKLIKLNTNENPYTLKEVEDEVKKQDFSMLRLYPDPNNHQLNQLFAKRLKVKESQLVWGNGSDEIIAAIFRTFLLFCDNKKVKKVILPKVTYGAYGYYALQSNIPVEYLDMNCEAGNQDAFMIPLNKLTSYSGRVVFFANPNAPSGKFIELDIIAKTLKANPDKVVVVDEAYIDFALENLTSKKKGAKQSAVSLVSRYPNLVVMRTFSKSYAACGLRLGVAVASEGLVEAIKKVLDPYNVNYFAQIMGSALIKHRKGVEANVRKVVATRDYFKCELEKLGVDVVESEANFLFITLSSLVSGSNKQKIKLAKDLFLQLEEKEILVRYFKQPELDQYLRISIGTDKEMAKVLKWIKLFIREKIA